MTEARWMDLFSNRCIGEVILVNFANAKVTEQNFPRDNCGGSSLMEGFFKPQNRSADLWECILNRRNFCCREVGKRKETGDVSIYVDTIQVQDMH